MIVHSQLTNVRFQKWDAPNVQWKNSKEAGFGATLFFAKVRKVKCLKLKPWSDWLKIAVHGCGFGT
jgi:hypothetical protein